MINEVINKSTALTNVEVNYTLLAVIEQTHAAWLKAREQGYEDKHPFALWIELWIVRPKNIERASVSVTGAGTRQPYEISEWGRNQWHEVAEVDTVEIDGVPYAVKLAEIGQPVSPNREMIKRAGNPMIYASTGERIDQLSFEFTTSRKPVDTPLALMAYDRFGSDLRKSLACDCAFLMKITFSANQSLLIPSGDGARLLARTTEGGFRRPKNSDRQRFELATNALRSMAFWIDVDGVFEWWPLVEITKRNDGAAIISKPAWFSENRYTVTGGLTFAHKRLQGQTVSGGIWRTIDAMEYYLARSAPMRRGKFNGIAEKLTPANGKKGAGGWIKLTSQEFLKLTGDHTGGTPRVRFHRRKERLETMGYLTDGRRPAQANDTVEFHFVRGGVWVRATEKGVEAARKAKWGEIETRSLNEILGNPIQTGV